MKLRIKGNTLRLRVSRSELERFLAQNRIEETTHFSPLPEAKLTYALESSPAATSVRYSPQEVAIVLSTDAVKRWADEGEVGVYDRIDIGPAGILEIAVEKDFACLDRSDEDNRDTFANPHTCAV